MSMLAILFVVLLVTVGLSLTKSQPDGTKPSGRTRLMSAARVVLVLVGVVLLAVAVRGYYGA